MTKKRISKKIISCFMLCALMMSSIMGFAINSNAADVDGNKSQRDNGTYIYYVGTQTSLEKAIRSARNGDCITFTDNIVCSSSISVCKNITIDFNYHSLTFTNETREGLRVLVRSNDSVTLKSGVIYGANNSDTAVYIWSGHLRLQNMSIFGGDKRGCGGYGNGIYVTEPSWAKIYMNNCYIQGGSGYTKSSEYSQSGKAIYTCGYIDVEIIREGMGYRAVDGICK